MKWLVALLGAAALAALAGCSRSAVPEPTSAGAELGTRHFPDLTLAEPEHGRKLYLSRCGACHVLKRPLEIPAERWPSEVAEMRTKNGVKLSDAEAQAISRYLFVAASAG